MRQVVERDGLTHRLGDRRDWFRLGMASATIVTPLISRWRALRAAERARALWQAGQAGARWPWAHQAGETEMDQLPPLARRDVRTGLWLAGVAVGLGAAGTAAFLIARRRLRADEPPLDLPLITRTGEPGRFGGSGEPPAQRQPGGAEGGAALTGERADNIPLSANGVATPSARPAGVSEMPRPPAPRFVGNTQTLLYVPADGADLPPDELRVYFASEAQATKAGYHAAPGGASALDDPHR